MMGDDTGEFPGPMVTRGADATGSGGEATASPTGSPFGAITGPRPVGRPVRPGRDGATTQWLPERGLKTINRDEHNVQ